MKNEAKTWVWGCANINVLIFTCNLDTKFGIDKKSKNQSNWMTLLNTNDRPNPSTNGFDQSNLVIIY